jgi:hypothetical protein
MKNYIKFILLFLLTYTLGSAQTITPVSGSSTSSLQAVQYNKNLQVKDSIDKIANRTQLISGYLHDVSGNTNIRRLNDINLNTYNSNTNLANIYNNKLFWLPETQDSIVDNTKIIYHQLDSVNDILYGSGSLTVSIKSNTLALATNSTALATSANQATTNTRLNDLPGNLTCTNVSVVTLENATLAGLETDINTALGAISSAGFISISYSTYWDSTAVAAKYSCIIMYK